MSAELWSMNVNSHIDEALNGEWTTVPQAYSAAPLTLTLNVVAAGAVVLADGVGRGRGAGVAVTVTGCVAGTVTGCVAGTVTGCVAGGVAGRVAECVAGAVAGWPLLLMVTDRVGPAVADPVSATAACERPC